MERTANRILPLYQGAFLGADTGAWALAPCERLRSKYLRALMRVGEAQQQCGQWQQAAHWYERGIDVEPIAEELYLQLICCYQHLQRHAQALTCTDAAWRR